MHKCPKCYKYCDCKDAICEEFDKHEYELDCIHYESNICVPFSLKSTGFDEPWSLADCVKMLCVAADILLHKLDYDGEIHEEILLVKNQSEKYLKEVGFEIKEKTK